jgi:hypothetical protein
MPVVGPGPVNCHKAFDEYGWNIATANRRVRIWITKLPETKSLDNGFMASVMALRVLAEGWSMSSGGLIARSEVDAWERLYLEWLDKKRSFPKKIDRDVFRSMACDEFTRLREVAVKMPSSVWASNAFIGLKKFEGEALAIRYNQLANPKQD